MEEKLDYYNEQEVEQILKNKEKLVFVDDGMREYIIKYDDLPDFIVDYNLRFGSKNLKIYDYQNPSMTPIITTIGIFLDKCSPEIKKDFSDKLMKVQLGGFEIKKYKVIDESVHEYVQKRMQKSKKGKEVER